MSLNSAYGAITGPPCGRAMLAPAAHKRSAKRSSSPFDRAFAVLTVPLNKFSAALRHRRELEQLARFSDRELRDLAVTRNDVDFALAEPLWRDPATSFRQARAECAGQTSKS